MASSTFQPSRIILVIGATGAQGLAVVNNLISLNKHDGSPSPWRIRALTRDPSHKRAKELEASGVELVQGSFMDFDSVASALEGCYGCFINTDGFTVGAQQETFAGIRIYELACAAGVRHLVWSSLDYAYKKGNWQPEYRVDSFDAKGRVADYIMSQPNNVSDPESTIWTILTSGPYMEMFTGGRMFYPVFRPDGTAVFTSPLGDGHIPLIVLDDLGFFARHIFDNPSTTAGTNLEVASDIVSWPYLIETFTKVTGIPAEYNRLSMDEFFGLYADAEQAVGTDLKKGTTWRQNFQGFWTMWRDDITSRDMDWVRSIHPGLRSLEQWMRETNYRGGRNVLLKDAEDKAVIVTRRDNEVLKA